MPRSVEALVDRQIRRWAIVRRSAQSVSPKPCIAISRLPAAGAEELGHLVAEQLGFAFFGIEIVDWIARRTGYRRELVRGVDERIRNAIERTVDDTLRRERFTEGDYLHYVVRTVVALGERGGAVILGRGAPFILPAERALRVLVVAPRADRIERLAKRHSLTRKQAVLRLQNDDAGRREFLQHHFRRDPDDPTYYDLTLNTGTLSLEVAAQSLTDALRAKFPAAGRLEKHATD